MQLRIENQRNPISDEVSALAGVTRPVLLGLLYALHRGRVERLDGHEELSLWDLAREYRASDGDCGVCFEYAVHDAVRRGDPMVVERVEEVMTSFCRIDGGSVDSILFGAEKQGSQRLMETAKELLTPESVLMYGTQGRPVLLRRHLDAAAAAFRTRGRGASLPQSISGLWKADLFLGRSDVDRWVGTTVKINPTALEPAKGLRVGIVPARGGADSPYKDDRRNLVVCPLRWDGDFMDIFYRTWWTVLYFIEADARQPKAGRLTDPAERQLAGFLEARRDRPVLEVVEALGPISQPYLLDTQEEPLDLQSPDHTRGAAWEASVATGAVLAPVPRQDD